MSKKNKIAIVGVGNFKYIKDPIYVSYTSLADFLKCPRSYYLKNIYKQSLPDGEDPSLKFRLQIASPYLTLGSTVHDTIKWYLENQYKPTKEETLKKFRNFWRKYRLKRGGFNILEEESNFGKRGISIIENFLANADVLEKSAPSISFPKYNLVENIVLIGNMDFVGLREDGSLHIVDFKTGAHDKKDPTQLYVYAILAEANFKKPVTKISFWYLDRDSAPKEVVLDPLDMKLEWLKEKGLELKKAIQENHWVCVKAPDLCRECRDYQDLLDGKGEFLFSDYRYKKQIYFLNRVLPKIKDSKIEDQAN